VIIRTDSPGQPRYQAALLERWLPQGNPLGVGTASVAEVRAVERDFIRDLRSNDPCIGYNRWEAEWSYLPTSSTDRAIPVGVHGLVLLAVPAVLLARTALSENRQRSVVLLAAGSVALAMAVLIGHALRQLPLSELPPIALATLGLCAVAATISYVITVRALVGPGFRS
jgi:uncharacterized membrane protein